MLRLDDDGGTPRDNPFFFGFGRRGDASGFDERQDTIGRLGIEVLRNLQRTFAYGVRNSFGMTFDPKTGDLWTTENGGRAFDEINRVVPGFNGGWVQVMGPLSRVQEFKEIEVGVGLGPNGPVGLQQLRFPATRIADTPEEARARLLHLPGFRLRDPEFSWKHVVPPAALGFIRGDGLGKEYRWRSDRGIGGGPAHQRGQPLSVPVESPADRVQVRRSRPPGQSGRQPRARRFRDRRR